MRAIAALALFVAATAHAEPPSSPYAVRWSFPADEISAIDVDRGDLSKSRFATDYELVKFLGGLKAEKPKTTRKPKPGAEAAPARELRVDSLDGDGKVRSTASYVATLEVWRKRLGEPMVERLEDEFDAHLRMILPRKVQPARTPGPATTP